MSHYMDFDPYVIRERNERMQRELDSLRLQQRLRGRLADHRALPGSSPSP